MAFQVNIPNEAAWAKEIGGSQTGVVQGAHYALKDQARVGVPRKLPCVLGVGPYCRPFVSLQSLRFTRTGVDLAKQ